jgi:hypothetical protein
MTRKNSKSQPQPYPYPQQPLAYPAYQPPVPPPAPADMYSVTVSLLSSHGATVARVNYGSVYNTGIPVTAAGSAKREPADAYDPETGRLLATSRALEILAGKLRRQANGRIRHAETVRAHREQARKRTMSKVSPLSPGEQKIKDDYFPVGSAGIKIKDRNKS